jgi:hypothetical protein
MNSITVPAALGDLLGRLTNETELRDAKGHVLGAFVPSEQARKKRYEELKKLFDPAETKRRIEAEHGTGCTTAELLEYLKSLETPG